MKYPLTVIPQAEPPAKPLTLDELVALRNGMIRTYQELPKQIARVQAEINMRIQTPSLHKLTLRQQEVLHYVRAQMSNKEIGLKLGITERTVKFHVSRLLEKLGGQFRKDL